ncbi:mannose-6-phosphate isomerase [Panus rudis PR-1116 ss-1]|nr:mannose-6-phosphate isomerase [Panus rudis PR-1116 ss-1]
MSATKPKALFRLKGSIQDYDWGKQGSTSLVARLGKNAIGDDFSLDEKGYYAEVWMGTHPNGPAQLFSDSTPLLDLIKSNPKHYLGASLLQKWPSTIHVPYLFKILSIAKALPLQAHPDKNLGEKLNRENSEEFVDANHKPEIAVAVGEPLGEKRDGDGWGDGVAFVGFVGFRPLEEIKQYVENVPELQRAIGDEGLVKAFLDNPSNPTLKNIYSHLLTRGAHHPEQVEREVRALVDKVKSSSFSDVIGTGETARDISRLLVKVDQQYPGSVGVFATSFFMNFIKLKKGESVYIGADEIHAYFEGDIIECMAISDNVLNAAFVPESQSKQHVPTFLSMLTYTSREPSHWILPHTKYKHSKTGKTQAYDPPLDEFVVLGTHLKEGDAEVLGAVGGPTIGIVTKGRVRFSVAAGEVVEIDEGGIVYVVPGCDVEADLVKGADGGYGEVWWATSMV